MRQFYSKSFAIILILLVVIIVAEGWFLSKPTPVRSIQSSGDLGYWQDQVKALGGAAAYARFKDSYARYKPTEQHQFAHIFGEALYRQAGVDGVTVCDTAFAYGCYHSFLGHAIKELGLSSVPMLNQKCIDKMQNDALTCQHGIGHGIQAALGYDFEDAKKALDTCATLPVTDEIGGCFGGVFMEYNFRVMLGTDGGARKATVDLNEPCNKIDSRFVVSCYYWQPQWWYQVLTGSAEQRYVQIGKMCNQLTDSNLRQQCLTGAGIIIPIPSNNDAAVAKKLCNLTSNNEQAYCLSGAANAFFAQPPTKELASNLCQDLDAKSKKICLNYLKLRTVNID